MIKNVLFDMGNVLIRFAPEVFVRNAGVSGDDQKLLLRELFGSIDWIELDRGTIGEAEIIERCTARVGEPLRGAVEKLVGRWDRPELPVEGMKALTDELYEKGYGLYLLTNAGPRHREYWPRFAAAEHFPEERVYRSADVHLLKPDPAFYEGALEKFGLDRTECVFIDDSAANAESARRVGLDAIVFFGDAVRLRGELRARGVNVGESETAPLRAGEPFPVTAAVTPKRDGRRNNPAGRRAFRLPVRQKDENQARIFSGFLFCPIAAACHILLLYGIKRGETT